MSAIMISAYAGAKQYNRTPLKMLKAIPAGFPLPLHDDMFGVAGHSDAIFSNIQSAGEDLRAFTSANMTPDTEIPIEIVTVTTGSNLLKGFARVPFALSINDKLYLRTTVGGGETAYGATALNGRNNVWQDYNLVLHGQDLTIDSSGNTSAGTNSGGVSKTGADLLNGWPAFGFGAREGTASTDRHTVPAPTDAEVATESIVFYKDSTEDVTTGTIIQWQSVANKLVKAATNEFVWRRDRSISHQTVTTANGELSGGAWHYAGAILPVVSSSSTIRFDGAALITPTVVSGSGTFGGTVGDLYLANWGPNTSIMDGRITEYRYRPDNTPTTAWLDLEWDTFNDPGALAEAEALVIV